MRVDARQPISRCRGLPLGQGAGGRVGRDASDTPFDNTQHFLGIVTLQIQNMDWLELARTGHRAGCVYRRPVGMACAMTYTDARVGGRACHRALQTGCQRLLTASWG